MVECFDFNHVVTGLSHGPLLPWVSPSIDGEVSALDEAGFEKLAAHSPLPRAEHLGLTSGTSRNWNAKKRLSLNGLVETHFGDWP